MPQATSEDAIIAAPWHANLTLSFGLRNTSSSPPRAPVVPLVCPSRVCDQRVKAARHCNKARSMRLQPCRQKHKIWQPEVPPPPSPSPSPHRASCASRVLAGAVKNATANPNPGTRRRASATSATNLQARMCGWILHGSPLRLVRTRTSTVPCALFLTSLTVTRHRCDAPLLGRCACGARPCWRSRLRTSCRKARARGQAWARPVQAPSPRPGRFFPVSWYSLRARVSGVWSAHAGVFTSTCARQACAERV